MDEKPALRSMPASELKVKPLYSTLLEHTKLAAGYCFLALAVDFGRMTSLSLMHQQPYSPFIPEHFLLLTAGSLIYLLFYKRYNYKLLTEEGLYFIRKGMVTYISWGMVQSAKIIHKSFFSYVQVDVPADPSTMWLLENRKERLFRYDAKSEPVFRKYLYITGLDR